MNPRRIRRHHSRHGGRPWPGSGRLLRIGAGAAVLALMASGCGASTSDGDDAAPASDTPAPGLTADTVKIGFSLAAPAPIGTGAEGVDTADEQTQVQAIVDYVNGQGGIAGRTVEPVYSIHEQNEGDASVGYQADCAAFTEDDQVFAAMKTANLTAPTEQFLDCASAHGTMYVADTQSDFGEKDFAKYDPYLVGPSVLGTDRWGAVVEALDGLGYFDEGAKVGVITFDSPQGKALAEEVTEDIAAKDVEVTDTQFITSFTDEAGFGKASAEVANMVLRFKDAGIDHVVFLATFGTGGFVFPAQAEAQDYHPRYALTTTEFPQVIAANTPPGQLDDAVSVGWDPGWDLDASQDTGEAPGAATCATVLDDAGVAAPDRAANRRVIGICDQLLFLQAALDGVDDPSAAALKEALADGVTYDSATTHEVSFGEGRLDGAGAVHGMRFAADCTCWKYDGDWVPAP